MSTPNRVWKLDGTGLLSASFHKSWDPFFSRGPLSHCCPGFLLTAIEICYVQCQVSVLWAERV